MFSIKRKTALVITATAAALAIGAGTAVAATTASAPPQARIGCVTSPHRTLSYVYENVPANFQCPAGFPVSLSGTGTAGPAGPKGNTGATGPAGPSGVTAVTSTDLGAITSVPTGGSFMTNATQAGTVTLKAGTYLLNLNAKATPNDTSTTAQVFPQFFVYDQPKNSDFTGDLFNVGSSPLEAASTSHDSYYSGSDLITLDTDTTLYVYAFGYDSDTGAGTYTLDDLAIQAVGVTPAS